MKEKKNYRKHPTQVDVERETASLVRTGKKNIDLALKVDVEEESSVKLSPARRMERHLPNETTETSRVNLPA
jgi:hypothetical protein